MTGPSQNLKREFGVSLSAAIKLAYPGIAITDEQLAISITKSKPGHGDLSSSVSFGLARLLKKAPQEIAKSITSMLKCTDILSKFEESGGYINASVDRKAYSRAVISAILERGDLYVSNSAGRGRKALIEYPSVNPSKPWHIGHLRNALLGDAIANIMAASSYNVEREDYIEDLGLQIAEILWGQANIGSKPDGKFDQWLGEQYVAVNKRLEEPGVKDQINSILKRMEDLSTEESRESRRVSDKCVRAQYETAYNYGLCHDVMIWESDIVRAQLLEKTIKMGEEKGVFERQTEGKYAKCLVVNLSKMKGVAEDLGSPSEETKVILRSNGTATYIAKDIALHMWKFGIIKADFHYRLREEKQGDGKPLYTTAEEGVDAIFGGADIAVNVIGSAQRYPQLVLRSVMALMGYEKQASSIIHISYGKVGIKGGSLSGRKGGWLGEGRSYTADTLLGEVMAKAGEIVGNSEKIADRGRAGEIAKAVAVGAIKFEFLRIAPEKEVTFSWDRALDFEVSSAPYCMYTYARARRILERAGFAATDLSPTDYNYVTDGVDFELAKLLGEAPEAVEKACAEYRPNIIADYLLELCSLFSRFYEKMPVINGGEARSVRLVLVFATMQVTRLMLLLLGIGTVDAM
jgi:arginyl-tRNA synthetase